MSLFALGAASMLAGLCLVRWIGGHVIDWLLSDELVRWDEEYQRRI